MDSRRVGQADEPLQLKLATSVLGSAMRGAGPDLLGEELEVACQTLSQNLIGNGYPGFWMEVPLLGTAGFDFHVCYDRPDLHEGDLFAEGAGFGHQGLVDWFVLEETGGVGLGFAHDLLAGRIGTPAVYVNTKRRPLDDEAAFFRAAGHLELAQGVTRLLESLPEGFEPWYLGVFGAREGSPGRVGCFLSEGLRHACVNDPSSFAAELRRVGFGATSSVMLDQIRELAQVPLPWEVQFDVFADGRVGDVLSLDLCLPLGRTVRVADLFEREAVAGRAARMLERWGVADGRWELVPCASFARIVQPKGSASARFLMRCYPSFIKAKWSCGNPCPAKVYFQCVARPVP